MHSPSRRWIYRVRPGCMSVFARLLLHNTPAFLELFRAAAGMPEFAPMVSGSPDPAQALLMALLDLWLDKVDAIGAEE